MPEVLTEAGFRSHFPVAGKVIVHLVGLDISRGSFKVPDIETHMKFFQMVVLLLRIHRLVQVVAALGLRDFDPADTPNRPSKIPLHVVRLAEDALTAVDFVV
jgi:hypothetical protein